MPFIGREHQDQIVNNQRMSRLSSRALASKGSCKNSTRFDWRPVLAGGALLIAGCTSYERRPLDLDATRKALLTRSTSDDAVRTFAESLAQREGRTTPYDPADGLSLEEAEAFALVYNPALRVARLEAGVTRVGAEHAGLWDDPTLGADLERVLSDTGGASRWVRGVSIGLTIPVSGRLAAARDRANAESVADWNKVALQEWGTRTHLREKWIDWSAARWKIEVAADIVARVRLISDLAQKQEAAGSMTRLEARLLRSELATREVAIALAKADATRLEHEIREIMGLHSSAPVDLLPTLAIAETPWGLVESIEVLESRNLDLVASRASYEVAEHSLREEIRKQYPDITLSPGVGSDQGDDRVSLGVSLSLPIWNRNQRGVAEAIARRDAASARFDATYELLLSRLGIAQGRLDAARSVRHLVETIVLPLAEEQEKDARRVAELGRLEPLMLLASLQSLNDAKVRAIEARVEEAVANLQIAALLGPSCGPSRGADDGTTPEIEVQSTTTENRRETP